MTKDCGKIPPAAPQPSPPSSDSGLRFFGKYRGTVRDNVDPLGLGRILAYVPAVPGMLLNWAYPCVPYAGLEVGLFALPGIGANVWIEFEAGDAGHPIWTGCFWESLEIPLALELSPEDPSLVKVFRSAFCTLIFNDTPGAGGITLSVVDPAVEVPVSLIFDSAGLQINCGPSSILINPEAGITLNTAETVISLSEAAIAADSEGINLTGDVTIEGAVEITGDVEITGAVEITGDTSVTGAVEVEGDTNVTGAVEIEGDLNVTGGLEVEGESNFAGALTAEGEANLLGALTAEGDANFLGAGQVEGNWAVLGVIEGVVVPPAIF